MALFGPKGTEVNHARKWHTLLDHVSYNTLDKVVLLPIGLAVAHIDPRTLDDLLALAIPVFVAAVDHADYVFVGACLD